MNMRKTGIILLLSMMMCCTGCTSGISDSEPNTDENDSVISDNGKQDETEEPNDGLVTMWLPEKVLLPGDEGEYVSELWQYDSNGNLIEYTEYQHDSKVDEGYSLKYDDKGNRIEKVKYSGYEKQPEYITTFNEKGDEIKEIVYYKGSESYGFDCEYVYDEKGRKVEVFKRYTALVQDSKDFYYYDINDRLIKEVSYNYKNDDYTKYDSCYETTYTYDEEGNLLVSDRLLDGEPDRKIIYEYNEVGKETLKKTVDGDGYYSEWRYEYDSKGNLTQKAFTSKGELVSKDSYVYDSKGNLIKDDDYEYIYNEKGQCIEKVHKSDSKEERIKCSYDKYGNLIKEEVDGDTSYISYTYFKVRVTPEQKEKIEKQLEEIK